MRLRNTGSVILAIMVLFSTLSFAVEKHFCGEMLMDLAIFSEPEPCCMELGHAETPEEDICCNDEQTLVEGQDDLRLSFEKLEMPQQVFLASFGYSYLALFEDLSEQVVPFKNYMSPLLIRDIQLLDETFLI